MASTSATIVPVETIGKALLEAIGKALQSTPTMKESLRLALEDLQSCSPALSSSLNFQWSDFDSHYSSLQTSLQSRFNQILSKCPQPQAPLAQLPPPQIATPPNLPLGEREKNNHHHSSPQQTLTQPLKKPKLDSQLPDLESDLKLFCIKMDAIGLGKLIMECQGKVPELELKVKAALRSAPDPAKLVLSFLQGYYPVKVVLEEDLGALLLRAIQGVVCGISAEVKKEAKKVAVGLIHKIGKVNSTVLFEFLTTYELTKEFSVDEFLDLVANASHKKAIPLIRRLGFDTMIPDIIRKLDSKGRQMEAIKFAYSFNLIDKFPPVPLLEAYLKKQESQHLSPRKEAHSLKMVIQLIDKYKIESQNLRARLEKRLEEIGYEASEAT